MACLYLMGIGLLMLSVPVIGIMVAGIYWLIKQCFLEIKDGDYGEAFFAASLAIAIMGLILGLIGSYCVNNIE